MAEWIETLLSTLPARLALSAILGAWLAGCAAAPAPTATSAPRPMQTFNLTLSGTVLMLDGKPGDPDGSGTATVTIDPETNEICWQIAVSDIKLPAFNAHIHRAPRDKDGPVRIALTVPDESGRAEGCTTAQIAQEILADPASHAVLIHTSDNIPGALRAQLAP